MMKYSNNLVWWISVLFIFSLSGCGGTDTSKVTNEVFPNINNTSNQEAGATPESTSGSQEGGTTPESTSGSQEGGTTPESTSGSQEGGTTPESTSGSQEGGTTP